MHVRAQALAERLARDRLAVKALVARGLVARARGDDAAVGEQASGGRARVPVDEERAAPGALDEQLGQDWLLDSQDDAVLAPQADGGAVFCGGFVVGSCVVCGASVGEREYAPRRRETHGSRTDLPLSTAFCA